MQVQGPGTSSAACTMHHILMVQSGACLPHCYLWPHERSPHLWPIFTALLRRASKQKRLCVPAAALWSEMTSDQNIPAGGGTLSRLEMQHDDAGRGPGAGLLLPGSSIPRHRSTCRRRAAPPLVKHYPCNTSPSPAFLTHTQIKHSALKKLIISIQFPCSEGVACSDPAAEQRT